MAIWPGSGIWNIRDRNHPHRFSLAFVVEEEECFVLYDRPPDRGAVLVVMEGRLGLAGNVEIIARIQCVIAEILAGASVYLVGSALGYDIDYAARVAPIFRLKVGDHVYFGDCIEGQNRGGRSYQCRRASSC